MKLFVRNKGGAQIAALQLEDPASLPRVGDELALPGLAAEWGCPSRFLVVGVVWVLDGQRLLAEVTCEPGSPEHHRQLLLRQSGWLPPAEGD